LTKKILAQKTIILEKTDSSLEEIAQTPSDLQLEQKEEVEELVVDCPDCFDTMIKVYDLDKARYQCENCDLTIGEYGWL
jgi:ribosomal protein S27E